MLRTGHRCTRPRVPNTHSPCVTTGEGSVESNTPTAISASASPWQWWVLDTNAVEAACRRTRAVYALQLVDDLTVSGRHRHVGVVGWLHQAVGETLLLAAVPRHLVPAWQAGAGRLASEGTRSALFRPPTCANLLQRQPLPNKMHAQGGGSCVVAQPSATYLGFAERLRGSTRTKILAG